MSTNEIAAAAHGSVWLDANRYYEAERRHYEMSLADLIVQAQKRANPGTPPPPKSPVPNGMSSLACEIAIVRERIQKFLNSRAGEGIKHSLESEEARLQKFEVEHEIMSKQIVELTSQMANVSSRLTSVEKKLNLPVNEAEESSIQNGTNEDLDLSGSKKSGGDEMKYSQSTVLCRLEKFETEHELMEKQIKKLMSEMINVLSRQESIEKVMNVQVNKGQVPLTENIKLGIQNGAPVATSEDDDELDLFGSDEEDAAAAKLKEERLQAYATKKAKKPALVAKSSVILDVKPWDDETDMKAMEKAVRGIQCEGLVWGASKLVPLAYGIKKLQIVAIVEDEKVSIDWLQETISEIEDLVQSVDVAAFNKL